MVARKSGTNCGITSVNIEMVMHIAMMIVMVGMIAACCSFFLYEFCFSRWPVRFLVVVVNFPAYSPVRMI